MTKDKSYTLTLFGADGNKLKIHRNVPKYEFKHGACEFETEDGLKIIYSGVIEVIENNQDVKALVRLKE